MTHHTEAERAAFEAVASDNGKWPKAIERDAKGDYLLMQTASGWTWWQAARRAPAAPVPQGLNLVPAEPTENMYMCVGYYKDDPAIAVTPEMVEAANEAYCPFGDMELALCAALQVAPIPPEAAPVQMPEPDSYKHTLDTTEGIPGNQPRVKRTERSANPFGVPEIDYDKSFPYSIEKLYTEQQVRQLLAAHSITGGAA